MTTSTSRLNKTPPIGDPKATDIPAAAAAERTSRLRAVSPSGSVIYFAQHKVCGYADLRCRLE